MAYLTSSTEGLIGILIVACPKQNFWNIFENITSLIFLHSVPFCKIPSSNFQWVVLIKNQHAILDSSHPSPVSKFHKLYFQDLCLLWLLLLLAPSFKQVLPLTWLATLVSNLASQFFSLTLFPSIIQAITRATLKKKKIHHVTNLLGAIQWFLITLRIKFLTVTENSLTGPGLLPRLLFLPSSALMLLQPHWPFHGFLSTPTCLYLSSMLFYCLEHCSTTLSYGLPPHLITSSEFSSDWSS